jgi:hypothetical protein
MPTAAEIAQIFDDQRASATELLDNARSDLQQAFDALSNTNLYAYDPYEWQTPSPPILLGTSLPAGPARPGRPKDPEEPKLQDYSITVPNPTFGTAPLNNLVAPVITLPSQPGSTPQDFTGTVPGVFAPVFPSTPSLMALPSSALPYPFITIPDAPVFASPVFDGVKPDDIPQISVADYLNQLTTSYTLYSQQLPALVKDNWFLWFRSMLAENPNIRVLDGIVTSYLTTGGAGIPVPIEEAIVTRATDRVTAEQQRKTAAVWQNMAAKGLTLPSGALLSGLKGARAESAEAVSKVATDVAIQNLTLEHDHMKFMLTLGRELQSLLMSFAGDTAKVVTEVNAQAIEQTKLVLTGMIEINNTNVRIYVAKWEGYKAAVEVFRAKWQAVEAQIRIYEAEIKAELAKTEINHAVVEVLTAMVGANKILVDMYKAQVDAESAKVEVSRVQIMGFEAQVRAYVAKVEGYKATWEGYRAAVDGQLAVAKVFESQTMGYKATVEGYVGGIDGYRAQVQGYSAQIEAVAKQNEAALKAWSIEFDGILKGYTADIDAYGRNWSAIGEQMKAAANVTGIQAEFLTKMYSSQLQIDMERAKEHFALWQQRLKAGLAAAEGITSASQVAANLANSTMNSLTAFAGVLTTGASS